MSIRLQHVHHQKSLSDLHHHLAKACLHPTLQNPKYLTPAPDLTIHEFFVFIGCIFFMACHPGVADRNQWWLSKDISPSEGAPFRLNLYMSKNSFKEIMGSLHYTSKPQLAQND